MSKPRNFLSGVFWALTYVFNFFNFLNFFNFPFLRKLSIYINNNVHLSAYAIPFAYTDCAGRT